MASTEPLTAGAKLVSAPVEEAKAAIDVRDTPATVVKVPPITVVVPTWAIACTSPSSTAGVAVEGTALGIAPGEGATTDCWAARATVAGITGTARPRTVKANAATAATAVRTFMRTRFR